MRIGRWEIKFLGWERRRFEVWVCERRYTDESKRYIVDSMHDYWPKRERKFSRKEAEDFAAKVKIGPELGQVEIVDLDTGKHEVVRKDLTDNEKRCEEAFYAEPESIA